MSEIFSKFHALKYSDNVLEIFHREIFFQHNKILTRSLEIFHLFFNFYIFLKIIRDNMQIFFINEAN